MMNDKILPVFRRFFRTLKSFFMEFPWKIAFDVIRVSNVW